jgi:hypothetical protein
MDRHDENREFEETGEMSSSSRDGDVLGLGGTAVPKAPGDPSASNDPASVRRRRERAMSSDSDAGTQEDGDRQRSGATGIDMGYGGQGTHVSGK